MTRIAAIVAVGSLARAKSRLGESLDAEEREDLVERLLDRTVSATLAVAQLADVLVVSPDRLVLQRAADLGARSIRQRADGLNAGLEEARADVVAGGATSIVVLPIDLPLVTSAAIAAILEPLGDAGPDAGSIVVVIPDRHGIGTNVLALRPPDAIDFAFGPGSRQAHRAAAETAGAAYVELTGPLMVDLDTPDDLVFVEGIGPEGFDAG